VQAVGGPATGRDELAPPVTTVLRAASPAQPAVLSASATANLLQVRGGRQEAGGKRGRTKTSSHRGRVGCPETERYRGRSGLGVPGSLGFGSGAVCMQGNPKARSSQSGSHVQLASRRCSAITHQKASMAAARLVTGRPQSPSLSRHRLTGDTAKKQLMRGVHALDLPRNDGLACSHHHPSPCLLVSRCVVAAAA
jgi:hypothetical protein